MLRLSQRMRGFCAHRRSRTAAEDRSTLVCEQLETRTLLSFPPAPVIPGPGETQILQNALKFAQKQQINAWDNQPIPFAVVGTNLTTGQVQLVKNNPTRADQMRVDIDVDSNPNTGKGGKDLSVSVSTELFLNSMLNPHLLATYDRLGTAPFAQNFEVLVSFPFSALRPGILQRHPAIDSGPEPVHRLQDLRCRVHRPTNGPRRHRAAEGADPLHPQHHAGRQPPAGANPARHDQRHNPLQFITGYFAAARKRLAGIQDAAAYAAWVQQPPATAAIGVSVTNSAIGTRSLPRSMARSISTGQTAASRTKVVFDYLEEGKPCPANRR